MSGIMLYNHYNEYPGMIERGSITATERASNYIVLTWDEAHSTDSYKVFYKVSENEAESDTEDAEEERDYENEITEIDSTWMEAETETNEIKVEGLSENTFYSFAVRPDNAEHDGVTTGYRNFKTKKTQSISVRKKITKLTSSKPFKLDVKAETGLMFESSDTEVVEVNDETGEITVKGDGSAEITVRAKSSAEYEADKEVVEVQVIKSNPVKAGGASAHIIYHLDSSNCEVVKKITGSRGAVVPQGLAYTGDKYIVSYGMGNPNRIIAFDTDGTGKDVYVPKASLGHPNGFTYADENGLCYCVKGWSSKAVTFDIASGKYGAVNLKYGCSGIGYDRKENLLYTCSRTAMVAYDISNGYSVVRTTGVVKHRGHVYTQDCGGHAGVLLRCLSGSSKHGTNYIDLYDMKNGKYLGTLSCDLSEVESCIVNEDGFLEILANNKSGTDYIWRTDLNIETIGEGL